MTIYLATDHAGFALKEVMKEYIASLGHEVNDMGNLVLEEDDDYPDVIYPCAKAVTSDKGSRGIILGGSGQGEAIVANKVSGIRAAVLNHFSLDIVKLSREHNDANILSIGARFITEHEAKEAVKLWLETPFSGDERHKRRIEKIKSLESSI